MELNAYGKGTKNCKFKLNFAIFFCVSPWIEIYIQIFYKHMSVCGCVCACVCGMHIYNLRLFGQQRHSTTANNVRNATNQTLPPPLPTHTPLPQLTTAMSIDHDAFGPGPAVGECEREGSAKISFNCQHYKCAIINHVDTRPHTHTHTHTNN